MTVYRQVYNGLTGQFNLSASTAGGGGLPIKAATSVATTGTNLTSTYFNGSAGSGATLTNSSTLAALSIDGVSLALNDRVLVKDQSAPAQNGIYVVSVVGSGSVAWVLVRAIDYNQPVEIKPGQLIPVESGLINANTLWIENNIVNNIGTDPIQFTQFSAPAFGTTNHAVLVGGPNNTVQSIGPGASGSVFVGNSGGNPDFSNEPTVTSMTILTAPVASTDAVNKAYADSISSGFVFKNGVQAASTGTLNALYDNGASGVGATLTNNGTQVAFVLDTYVTAMSDRVLIKDQSTTFQNGIYEVTDIGSGATNWVLTRTTDFDSPSEIAPGSLVGVLDGSININTFWAETQIVTTVGTDPILFSEFSSAPIHTTQYETLVGGVNNAIVSIPTGGSGDIFVSSGNAANPSYVTPTIGTGLTGTFNSTTHEYGLDIPVEPVNGGTGIVSPTIHTLLVAQGASAMHEIGPGTAGDLIVSGGASADPSFVTPTIGTGLTGTFNASTFEYALDVPVTPADGGTGLSSPAAHSLLVTEGSSNFALISPDTAGKILVAKGMSADPGYVTPTMGTGLTGTFNSTTHEYALTVPVTAPDGGTGAVSIAAHTVVVAEGASAMVGVGPGSTGQVLQSGGASADPAYSTATYPAVATGSGTLLRADGTNWAASTSTYPNTNAINTLLYASGTNQMAALPTANNGTLVTGATGVPSVLAGPGTTGNLLQSNAAAAPSFSTATYPSSTTINEILYSSATNVVDQIAAANNGVLITGATGVPSLLPNGTGGYVLTANTGAPPSWLPASGGGGSVTSVTGTLNRVTSSGGTAPQIDIDAAYVGQTSLTTLGTITTGLWNGTTVAANHGGTGQTSNTAHGVLLGQGSSSVTATAAGSSGQILQSGGASADPAYTTATYPATTAQGDLLLSSSANTIGALTKDTNSTRYLSNTGTNNNAAWAQIDVTNGITGIVPVGNGGLGVANPGAHTFLIGEGTSPTSSFGPGTAGQIPVSGGVSADPGYVTPTFGTGLTGTFNASTHQYALVTPVITGNGGTNVSSSGAAGNVLVSDGSNWTTSALSIFGLTFTDVTGSSQAMAQGKGYTSNDGGSLVTFTLPTTAAYGSGLAIVGKASGLWKLAQNASQVIHYNNVNTTAGITGFLSSINQYDLVFLLCTVANLEWTVIYSSANLNYN